MRSLGYPRDVAHDKPDDRNALWLPERARVLSFTPTPGIVVKQKSKKE